MSTPWPITYHVLEEKMDIKEAYRVMAKNCGIKVGDIVKVLRKAKSREMGWNNAWGSSEMDHFIGEEGVVQGIDDDYDFRVRVEKLDDWFNFPFFVLEKVKDGIESIELEDYTVQFKEGGTIEVGCQTIDFETVKKIYDRAKSTL